MRLHPLLWIGAAIAILPVYRQALPDTIIRAGASPSTHAKFYFSNRKWPAIMASMPLE